MYIDNKVFLTEQTRLKLLSFYIQIAPLRHNLVKCVSSFPLQNLQLLYFLRSYACVQVLPLSLILPFARYLFFFLKTSTSCQQSVAFLCMGKNCGIHVKKTKRITQPRCVFVHRLFVTFTVNISFVLSIIHV